MKNNILFSLFLFAFSFSAKAQNQKIIDSLETALKSAKEDTIKINMLNSLAFQLISSNPVQCISYAEKAIGLANKLNFLRGRGYSYIVMGTAMANLGDTDEGLKNVQMGLTVLEKTGDKLNVALANNNMGGIYQTQGKLAEAMKSHLTALKIRKEINDKKGTGRSYFNIGNIYKNQSNFTEATKFYAYSLKIAVEIEDKQGAANAEAEIGVINIYTGNYAEALKHLFTSLKIREEIGDKRGTALSLSLIGQVYNYQASYPEALKYFLAAQKIFEEIDNQQQLAGIYNNIGVVLKAQENFAEALNNFLAGLKIFQKVGDKYGVATAYTNIGEIYQSLKNYNLALKYYNNSVTIFTELGDQESVAFNYANLGEVNIALKKLPEAKKHFENGLKISFELGTKEAIKDFFKSLSELDSLNGDFKQAFKNHKMYILYRDSLFNEENTKKIVQQQMQYDFDKKESLTKAEQEKKDAIALKELQKQKLIRNGFTGGFAIVLLFAGVFFTQRNKISKGKKRSDELLLNILPSEVAEELKAKGSADAKQFEEVTVMFTDFKGFTQISEKLSPAELVNEIHTCFKAFDNIISKHNIEKIKTIGDSYMCAGGLPVVNKTHANDVVKAALEIQQFMHAHLQERKNADKEIFEIRIGIHTGTVVAGIVGVKKFAYDIWGDTVNIASRMESSGEAGKVNISGTTYESVKDKFNCTHRGKISAKNKGEIEMYFVETVS